MTAQAVALGLRARYPIQAAKAKALHRYLRAMGPWSCASFAVAYIGRVGVSRIGND